MRTGAIDGNANNSLLVSGASADRAGSMMRREAKPAAIEFAQRQRIGDRRAALQRRRALRCARRQHAAEQEQDDDKKSQRAAHILTNTALETPIQGVSRRLLIRKIAEKRTDCLAAIASERAIASRRGEAIRIADC